MLREWIYRGEAQAVLVEIKDDDGVPVVLDGEWDGLTRIIDSKGNTVADIPMSIDGSTMTCVINSETLGLPAGKYYYDSRITDPNGARIWTRKTLVEVFTRITPTPSELA